MGEQKEYTFLCRDCNALITFKIEKGQVIVLKTIHAT